MRPLFVTLLLLAAPLAAQTTVPESAPEVDLAARPALGAYAVDAGAIVLDGVLDEMAWGQADPATGFVQQRPEPGAPASEQTQARVVYDGAAIYVGMRMDDSQASAIEAPLGRRDANLSGDWAIVAFDSYDDDRTAFVFALNPAGVQKDILLFDDVNEDESWDAVWDGATSRDENGWTAEFRIPLSQLRYAASEGEQAWGVQFGRDIHRTGESAFWSPWLPDDNGVVSLFGTLGRLRGLRPPRQLELVPYVASALTRAPTDDPFDPYYASNDLDPRIGLDLKYGITSDMTLTATINPDFGQVEADPAQVNLGGFELFFEERRPFFVEGTDVFSMDPRRFFSNGRPQLLYTRRIGRSPQRSDFLPEAAHDVEDAGGTVYTDAPQQSTILGAAKLSGRVGPFSVGVLNATTAPEYGYFRAFDEAGEQVMSDRALVEPVTNFAVGRARGTVGGTIVGGLVTSVVRDTGTPGISSLLPTQATVGGVDVEHKLSDDWVINGQVAGSLVTGSEESILRLQTAFPRLYQRPDADHLAVDSTATSLSGMTAEVNVLKAGGEHWVGGLHLNSTTPGFDSNELGFQNRADNAGIGGVIVYQQNQAQGPFQRWSANLFGSSEWNYAGDNRNTFVGGNMSARLKNFWGGNLNWNAWPRTTGDRTTRGGPLTTDPAGFFLGANVSSDYRKPVSGYLWTGMNRTELGDRYNGIEAGIEARPSPSLSLRVGPELDFSHSPRQFVTIEDAPDLGATFGRRYVFATIDQTTLSLETRVNWTFSPRLSLQVYARPFVSRGRYTDFKQMTAPGQLDFPLFADSEVAVAGDGEVTITPADGGGSFSLSPDFTVRALQGNAVLRWEYRPGSALFLVWQQQRNGFEPDGAFEFGRDVGGLFTDPVTNVFLVKFSYWLG